MVGLCPGLRLNADVLPEVAVWVSDIHDFTDCLTHTKSWSWEAISRQHANAAEDGLLVTLSEPLSIITSSTILTLAANRSDHVEIYLRDTSTFSISRSIVTISLSIFLNSS